MSTKNPLPVVATITGDAPDTNGELCFIQDAPYTPEAGAVRYVSTRPSELRYRTKPSFDSGSIENTVTRLLADGHYRVIKASPEQAGAIGQEVA